MKKVLTGLTIATALMTQAQNPLTGDFNTVHGTAPFSKIENAHYEPAIDRGINLALKEIDAITANHQRSKTPLWPWNVWAPTLTGRSTFSSRFFRLTPTTR